MRARFSSAVKSSTSSIPIDMRTRSADGAIRSLSESGMLACDIADGRLITEFTDPKLTAIVNSRAFETT
ncbi:MAG: hypothetical protein QOK02_6548 [Mycobacterium sp.]|nr:hypothetical protein [Mycobacterium sp.]